MAHPHRVAGGQPVVERALAKNRDLRPPTMTAFCRERLAGYKVPRRVEFLDELPRNPSGKVLKRVLREES